MLPNSVYFVLLGASVALSLAVALVLIRDRGIDALLRGSVILLVATGAVFTAIVGPAGSLFPTWAMLPLQVVAASGVVFQWSIAHLLFDRRYSHGRAVAAPALLIGMGMVLPMVIGAAVPGLGQVAAAAVALTALALVGEMLWMLVLGRLDDLDTDRRLLRLLLAAGAAAFDILVLAAYASNWREARPIGSALWMAGAKVGFKLAWLTLTAGQPSALVRLYRTTHATEPSPTQALAAPVSLGGIGQALAARHAASIIDAMESRRLFRQQGLSVSDLAAHLRLSEHRVRAVINGHLKFRNYSAFVNHFRLREVAKDLRDPAKAHLPILTLALDAGYASVGPFNRAFRAAYGQSPSEYRQAEVAEQARVSTTLANQIPLGKESPS